MSVLVGLLALVNLFVLHTQPFGGDASDIGISVAVASTSLVYVLVIMLPARNGQPQTMIGGATVGFLVSGSVTQAIATNSVWLAKLPHMVAVASVGAVMVIIGCCMSFFAAHQRP